MDCSHNERFKHPDTIAVLYIFQVFEISTAITSAGISFIERYASQKKMIKKLFQKNVAQENLFFIFIFLYIWK